MSTIVTRTAKGAPLTNAEIDANFTNLNTDKLEKAGGAVTGALTVGGALAASSTLNVTGASTLSGNVGIGTPATGARLDVQAASNAYSRLKTTSSGYALFDIDAVASQQSLIRLLAAGSEQGRISSGANEGAGIMVFATGTGATEAMRLIGGRVAINRNSASFYPGTARTAIAYPGNTDWALGLRDTSAQSTVWPIVFLNSSEGIAGSVAMTATSTSYNTSSDERLKENIEDAADPGAVIDAIQIRQFDWIATGEHQDYGVVAQELEQVYPPAVPEATVGPYGEEMYRGVDYSKLVPLLVKEVQLLRARVAQLEGGSQ